MSEEKLKTAVLGLSDKGALLLKAASQIDAFRIDAVADRDAQLAERTAEQYRCTPYDDYRQLIIQNQFDCLLVTAPLCNCIDHIKAAIEKKFNVLTLPPLARNFEEAAEFVRLAEERHIIFAVANPGRFAPGFLALREFLQQGRIEQIFLLTATCSQACHSCPPWQTDPKLAGGGVLLYNCYGIIDRIVSDFSLPQQVYALNASLAGDRKQRQYLTEDTALVTMKFDDILVANLTASRYVTGRDEKECLNVYGKDMTLTVSSDRFAVTDLSGRTINKIKSGQDRLDGMKKLLDNFAAALISPDKNKPQSTGRENLKNMALIEAAYLSARTGFPEQPERILKMARLKSTGD